MNQLSVYIDQFFSALRIGEDAARGHHYKDYIEAAVERFLADESKENAHLVYQVFLDAYGYGAEGEDISFIRLLEKMRVYEENAAVLTMKQRDHFIHSVNVFLLGIAIYQSSAAVREAFEARCYLDQAYDGRKDTPEEEFFFRWGLAALCHDIGYPIEIITNQVNDFINFANQLRKGDRRIYARIEYDEFALFNLIPEHVKKRAFIKAYYDKHETCVYVDLLRPVDLLAHKLSLALDIDLNAVKGQLDRYVDESGKSGRVDHGFFSALILLKWYGYLIQLGGLSPDRLYYPVLDCASAILLHNFYNIALVKNTKRPNAFGLGPLELAQHPIAYLLILCDELQEWNREPYGALDMLNVGIKSASVMADEGRLDVTYIIDTGAMPEEFVGKKVTTLNTLLNLSDAFPNGFSVGCESVGELPFAEEDVPTLNLEALEKLAIAIHNRYNRMALKLNPDKVIEYPNFSDLPKEKKLFNLRCAIEYPKMLQRIDCEIRPLGSADGTPVERFSQAEIEMLAELEHERWMNARLNQGWVLGAVRDKAAKTNPCLVPYGQLDESIKEYDRDPVRNIPALLRAIGLGVFRRKQVKVERFTEDQIDVLARSIHAYYNARTAKTDPWAVLVAFDDLSEEKREANRRQARGIPNKLRHIGCALMPKGTSGRGEMVEAFSPEVVEMLARIEHDEWSGEKIANGWRYGLVRDEENKVNPFLVDYDQLDERIKEYDRDTVRNMPALAAECGYAIYRKGD